MDELIEDFLMETKEGLEAMDNDIVTLEKEPEEKEIIDNIFRTMHTIKGTCGFLGLSRLERVAHVGEDLFDKIREGAMSATPEVVSLILKAVDQIKYILDYIEENETEPEGDDDELIAKLRACVDSGGVEAAAAPATEEAKPEAVAAVKKDDIPRDNEDLQALFDETESLVDTGEKPAEKPREEAKPAAATAEKKDDIPRDNSDLQALFDSTESLVDTGEKPAEVAKPEAAVAKVEEKPTPAKKAKKKPAMAQNIRVNIDVLEALMQQASELVLTRNQLLQILRTKQDSDFSSALQRLNNITTELQERVMKTRMQPVGNAWTKLPRVVRDLDTELDKKIELKMIGEETELDRQLLELITDPLTHMVRNSADHGLEATAKRLELGKPEIGTIELKAFQTGGYIIIQITDDGGGIDPAIIKAKAIEKELVSEEEANLMSDNQILRFIFAAGFSTAAAVTSVSGRGVGMDVVRSNIEQISGTVDLESTLGKGSVFTIKIPLTLAIMSILQVSAGNQKFAIPQINVVEIVKVNGTSNIKTENISDKPILRLREHLLPLVSLAEVLQIDEEPVANDDDDSQFVVICEVGNYNFGVLVDEVYDTEEIVVKPMSSMFKDLDVYAGSTILGDGKVILIIDPNGLAKNISDTLSGGSSVSDADDNLAAGGEEASFIVFKAGDSTPKVVPLELVSRLEEIDVSKIEKSGGRPVIQYRGDLMRLTQVDENYELPVEGKQELLVLASQGRVMGLVVEEIVDIAKAVMDEELKGGSEGLLGSMVIDDKTCDVIDVSYYFDQLFSKVIRSKKKMQAKQSNKNLLLIDDSPFFRKFIPPELESQGYHVEVASSAKEAFTKLEGDNSYGVIITDINMPGMSGNEFAEICRKDERFMDTPIIALSSQTGGEDKFETGGYNDIFDDFVSKTNHGSLIDSLENIYNEQEKVS